VPLTVEEMSMPKTTGRNSTYIYSRLSGDALASLILSHYDFSFLVKCEFFVLGLHDNYLVEAGAEKYFLRVYRTDWRSKEEILFEVELLTFLHERSLPVAFPLMNRASEYTRL
jgi:Ser/Thr protein kinase RdoA (MazF antagonist)